jgi:hypothetical protein
VSWEHRSRRFRELGHNELGHNTSHRRADAAAPATPDADLSSAPALPASNADLTAVGSAQVGQPADDRGDKIRKWRRRALLTKGAQMYSAMGVNAGQCSLAMLDPTGVVVAWYDLTGDGEQAAGHVVDRHVSQFYVPEDIASGLPLRDLHVAVVNGSSEQQGWCQRPDGGVFWGATLIDAVVLRDGRLQGFSHVTRKCACSALRAAEARASRRSEVNARRPLHSSASGGPGFLRAESFA